MWPPEKMMRVEVQQGDAWVDCPDFGALQVGDVIRWFQPDGTPAHGGQLMRVASPAAIKVDFLAGGADALGKVGA